MRTLVVSLIVVASLATGQTYTDSDGEVGVEPTWRSPLIQLPCPKTDIVGATIEANGSNVSWTLRVADLEAHCSDEKPGFQAYLFGFVFTPANWDRAIAWVVIDAGNRFLFAEFSVEHGSERYIFYSPSAGVDAENDTVTMSLSKAWAEPPFSYGVFGSWMDECPPEGCRMTPVVGRGDRLPDVGFIEYVE